MYNYLHSDKDSVDIYQMRNKYTKYHSVYSQLHRTSCKLYTVYILLIICICVVDLLHTKLLAAEALKLTGHWIVHRLVGEK